MYAMLLRVGAPQCHPIRLLQCAVCNHFSIHNVIGLRAKLVYLTVHFCLAAGSGMCVICVRRARVCVCVYERIMTKTRAHRGTVNPVHRCPVLLSVPPHRAIPTTTTATAAAASQINSIVASHKWRMAQHRLVQALLLARKYNGELSKGGPLPTGERPYRHPVRRHRRCTPVR